LRESANVLYKSPYITKYYCAKCMRWMSRLNAVYDEHKRPHCPRCGYPLRKRPRNAQRIRQLTAAERKMICNFYKHFCLACPLYDCPDRKI
jgi:DNA-directed RNA polymerase subunit RPC12/RpoP